jgi:hypothetical protein
MAAVGNVAALAVFDEFGPDCIYARNRQLTAVFRVALTEIGWHPVDLPDQNQSTIVSVPLGDLEAVRVLRALASS